MIAICLLGSFLSMDRTAFLQVMISRPIVAGWLTGLCLGEPLTGLLIGSILELLWIGYIPLGASIPPHETIAAVASAYIGIKVPAMTDYAASSSEQAIWVFSILLALPIALLGRQVDIMARNYNRRFVIHADSLAEEGKLSLIERENLRGLVTFFAASFIALVVFIQCGLFLTKMLSGIITGAASEGLIASFYMLFALGITSALKASRIDGMIYILSAGCLTGFLFYFAEAL